MFESKLRDLIRMTAVNQAMRELMGEFPIGCIVQVRFPLLSGGMSAKSYSYWSTIPLKVGDEAIVKVEDQRHMDGGVYKRVVVESVLGVDRSLAELSKFESTPKMIVAKVDEGYKSLGTISFKNRVKQIESELHDKAMRKMARDLDSWLSS